MERGMDGASLFKDFLWDWVAVAVFDIGEPYGTQWTSRTFLMAIAASLSSG